MKTQSEIIYIAKKALALQIASINNKESSQKDSFINFI